MPSRAPSPRALVRRVSTAPGVRALADATRVRRSVATIRRSGLFDEAWYRAQLPGVTLDDPIEHFVTTGAARGLQPSPLFDPAHYREHDPSAGRTSADPFTHFLAGGGRRLRSPHPLFDPSVVTEHEPGAAEHPHGPLGWYLADLDRRTPPPTRLVDASSAPTPAAYLELVRRAVAAHAAVPDHRDFPRSYPAFDHARADAFVARARAAAGRLSTPPLVSVVVPTRDRAEVIGAAIESVLGQSWRHLELLIVDDGSTDDTAEVVAGYDDDRLRYLPTPPAGVSRARNLGLEQARGDYIAYLDSDNTWLPHTLEVMVGFLAGEGHRAGYSAAELHGDEGVEYRGAPLDRDALDERNYIDLNTLVHERSLVDEVGGFDTSLRRVVDWDLLLRLADVTDLAYAPFVSTVYDAGDDRRDRITLAESIGYRYEVRAKRLVDWRSAPDPVAGTNSVLLVAMPEDEDQAATVARVARAQLEVGTSTQVVVVDDGTPMDEALRLRLLEAATDRIVVRRIADRVSRTAALNVAASIADGDVLVVADPTLDLDPVALARCATLVREGRASVVQPVWVDPDGTVGSSGWLTTADGRPVAVGAGLALHEASLWHDTSRDACDPFGYAVETARFRAVGGLAPVFVRGGGELDLGRRLREAGGTIAVAQEVTATLSTWPAARRYLLSYADDRELQRRGGTGAAGTYEELLDGAGDLAVSGYEPVPVTRFHWRGTQRWGAVHVRRPGSRRRWAIKTSVPGAEERDEWGDWHFAVALRDALTELGEHAVVDTRRAWYRASAHLDDVDVVLRGTQRYEPPPGRTSLLWVISHPDEVTAAEAALHDRVLVASASFAAEASRRWQVPVDVLLQATDPSRFHPDPDPSLATPLLFVGNSRGVRRRVVADALEAGLEPVIYGQGWDGLVPSHLVRGTHVPNDQLGRYYASAEVVLADHWDDMRDRGFVANRLFDAVASGAAVVCDQVPGVEDLFAGAVRTYRDASDLPAAIEAARRARRELPDAEVTHTFLERARQLLATVEDLPGRRS